MHQYWETLRCQSSVENLFAMSSLLATVNFISVLCEKSNRVLFVKDSRIFYQTFTHHWVACRDRIHSFEPLSEHVYDDILTVTAQIEQMLQLLQMELGNNNNSNNNSAVAPMSDSSPTETSILDMILSDKDNILAQIVSWTKSIPYTQSDQLLVLEIQLCEVLLSCKRAGQTIMSHVKVLKPLLALLDIISNLPQGHEPSLDLQSSLLGKASQKITF